MEPFRFRAQDSEPALFVGVHGRRLAYTILTQTSLRQRAVHARKTRALGVFRLPVHHRTVSPRSCLALAGNYAIAALFESRRRRG